MFLVLLACVGEEPAVVDSAPPEPGFPAELVGDADDGEQAFQLYCATCHGVEARGGLGPDLALRAPQLDDPELYEVITEGRLPRMPPLRMTDQEAIDIVAWLRARFGEP